MPSSTSSFKRELAEQPWALIFGAAVAVFACFAGGMELQLARLGYQPTVSIGKDHWVAERIRANELGSRALVIIGASRIQLGLDLGVLRANTGLEPVQLAIDASLPYPVLAGLAQDPAFKGTVIVDYYPQTTEYEGGPGADFHKSFEAEAAKTYAFPTGSTVEKYLTRLLHENLRVYSDGANPWLSLRYRIMEARPQNQYLITMADRSRKADYRKVKMPEFYHNRVARTLGIQIDAGGGNIESLLRQKINEQMPLANSGVWQRKVSEMRKQVEAIRARGGRVLFIGMPSSGMVREIEERRYPKAQYWDYFEQNIGAPALHSNYTPILQDFVCPDGSHLDMRNRAAFTENLVRILKANRFL